MAKQLTDMVALVTGSSSGIGAATARLSLTYLEYSTHVLCRSLSSIKIVYAVGDQTAEPQRDNLRNIGVSVGD